MKFQSHIIEVTHAAAKEFFRYASAVPADKLEWEPVPGARSVLDQCQEIAMTPGWAVDVLEGKPFDASEEAFAAIKQEQQQWTTVQACHDEFLRRMKPFEELVNATPDEDLSKTHWLPFDGGRDFTYAEMMDYPRWNLNYHLGQVAYIQMMYGDKEMH